MNMQFHRKLPIPKDIKEQYPLTDKMIAVKQLRDMQIRLAFQGKSDKFLLIIGPCSADNYDSALDYISRLRLLQDKVADKIILIPRIYTNKPRTTTAGYKGMLHQPDPGEKPDMLKGILATRSLHTAILRDYHFTCADEMLYPENHRYLSDLLSYVSVGARSVENQQHRLTASGLSIPVGLKNPTSGDLAIMMNAIKAAQSGHTFIYRGWEVESAGNDCAHAILRGYTDVTGKYISNYHYDDLMKLSELYADYSLKNPSVIIDTNHANSGKNYLEQIQIANEVVSGRNADNDIKRLVKGLMIESYIEDGAQSIDEHIYGKSITDPCLGWSKTEALIFEIAEKL